MINIKSDKEIELMRKSASILKKVLIEIENGIKPGVTTNYLNDLAEKVIKDNNAIASFKNVPCPYKGGKAFKHAICVSVNDEIIHGIPSNKILKSGDIVSIDLGILKDGFHTDAGRTYIVGENSKYSKFVKTAEIAFFEAMKYAKPGFRIGDISNAIEQYVTNQRYTLLDEFEGHGIGRSLHEEPSVPNKGIKNKGPRLEKGMALAIEPMICEGSNNIYLKEDNWTIATVDKKMTTYYENTIIITENEPEILTL